MLLKELLHYIDLGIGTYILIGVLSMAMGLLKWRKYSNSKVVKNKPLKRDHKGRFTASTKEFYGGYTFNY